MENSANSLSSSKDGEERRVARQTEFLRIRSYSIARS